MKAGKCAHYLQEDGEGGDRKMNKEHTQEPWRPNYLGSTVRRPNHNPLSDSRTSYFTDVLGDSTKVVP